MIYVKSLKRLAANSDGVSDGDYTSKGRKVGAKALYCVRVVLLLQVCRVRLCWSWSSVRAVSEMIVSVFGLDVTDLSGLIITTATASALLQLGAAQERSEERRTKKNEFQKSTILGMVPVSNHHYCNI